MAKYLIGKEQARQFAYDCYDVIMRDIKAAEEAKKLEKSDGKTEEMNGGI